MDANAKVVLTVMQMLRDRGYELEEHDLAFADEEIDFDDYMSLSLDEARKEDPGDNSLNEEWNPFQSVRLNVMRMRMLTRRTFYRRRTSAEKKLKQRRDDNLYGLRLTLLGPTEGHSEILTADLSVLPLDNDSTVDGLLMIVDSRINHSAREKLESLSMDREVISSRDMYCNPILHVMTPPHEAMSTRRADALLAEFGVKRSDMPIIRTTDPVARYYGWARGTLITIRRPAINAMAAELQYRVVA